jgi:hypothetical protein
MNKSLGFSRLQLATIGVFCCILGTRILLRIGSPESLFQTEDAMPEQIAPPIEELPDRFLPLDVQNIDFPNTQPDTLGPLPSQLDSLLNRNRFPQ